MVNVIKLCFCAMCATLTAILAQIRMKIFLVPYTMQNFGVVFSGLLLGAKYGFLSQLVYLILVAFGLPLASGFRGGLGILLGPTSGYLLGFPVAAAFSGIVRKIWEKTSKNILLLWIFVNLASLPIYIFGCITLYIYGAKMHLLLLAILPFLPQDFFMDHFFAVILYKHVKEILKQKGVLLD